MALLSLLTVLLLAFVGHVPLVYAKNIVIPGPDSEHKYKPAVASFSLNDQSRKDAWDTADNRKIMVSVFMPIPEKFCTECALPYMPDQTAKISNDQFFGDKNKGVFEPMQYKACCGASGSVDVSKLSVVVIDPHTDTSRLLYANLARFVSANNVVVVLIDHPHDSSIVEFEDKSIAYNSDRTGLSNFSPLTTWNETVRRAVDIRVKDINLALDSLSDPATLIRAFPSIKFTSGLDTSAYGIVGHGLGGTVATTLGTSDPRAQFSINLSGSSGPLTTKTKRPTYFLGRQNFVRDADINWPEAWKHLIGPATEFDLQNSEIMDFTDLPVIIELGKSQDGAKDLKPKAGIVGGQGAWGNHAVVCFVEGIIKQEFRIDDKAVSNCIWIFGDERMVPYAARLAPQAFVEQEAKKSGAMSRRARSIRHVVKKLRWA
ncbi:hypothetical protein EK21DRAFT_116026 [Setomelanomma holmii]|uniref:1-alkyl-2-acetylglycerophosphocholine esterase n=1 Tax=Setomelanomma holmii TaxID=210430 RepID=A0A9P4H2P7_9PLEO|nr:hypothetical protein EK21DRAFT_116026 [Setomelanomma holmii]